MTSGNRGYPAADDAAASTAEPSTNGFYVEAAAESQASLDEAAQTACRWLNALAATGVDLRVNAHRKAAHEAQEFADEPSVEEAADTFIALVGGLLHIGATPADLASAVDAKVAVNWQRTWVRQDDGTFQHMPDQPATAACTASWGQQYIDHYTGGDGKCRRCGAVTDSRKCSLCHRVQSADVFGNPHAPDICEGCYRAAGVDIWAAGDE